MFRPVLTLLITFFLCRAAIAHEFWIEPDKYQAKNGEVLTAQLKNGQKFSGINLGYFENRFERFDMIQNGESTSVDGRMGDVPALQITVEGNELLTIVHQTQPSKIRYKTWDMFQAFVDHKGFANVKARHQALGFPKDKFSETYTRYAKSIVAVGDGSGSDSAAGLEYEIIAITNPYEDKFDGNLLISLLYQSAPAPDMQVEVFDRDTTGIVSVTKTRTDASGQAQIRVKAGHTYLLDSVFIREAARNSGSVWETLWASLTFAVPE